MAGPPNQEPKPAGCGCRWLWHIVVFLVLVFLLWLQRDNIPSAISDLRSQIAPLIDRVVVRGHSAHFNSSYYSVAGRDHASHPNGCAGERGNRRRLAHSDDPVTGADPDDIAYANGYPVNGANHDRVAYTSGYPINGAHRDRLAHADDCLPPGAGRDQLAHSQGHCGHRAGRNDHCYSNEFGAYHFVPSQRFRERPLGWSNRILT